MMWRRVFIGLTATLTLGGGGCAADPQGESEGVAITTAALPLSLPADDLLLTSDSAVTARRTSLIQFIWGQSTLPNTMAVEETPNQNCPTSGQGLPNLIDPPTQLRVDMSNSLKAYACHLKPIQPNGRLVILHQGHGCFMFDDTDPFYSDTSSGWYRTVYHLLNEGFGVLFVYMPKTAPTDCPAGAPHDAILPLTPPAGSSLQYFLTGALGALNKVQAQYQDINMVGLSGGGWTTAWYAALDPRIKVSIVASGAIPFQFWPAGYTDEQVYDAYYKRNSNPPHPGTGYKDLFLMGSHGDGRRQVSVLRRQDTCCFSQSAGWDIVNTQTWANDVHDYEAEVRAALANMGSKGMFRVEIDDTTTPAHTISRNTVTNVILAELQGARRHIGAADSSDAFVRGANGHIWQRTSSSWTDTGLFAVGVPAVVKVNGTLNLFFRDRDNHLVRAVKSGTSWTTTALGGTIISDPVAVSRSAGVWDVVAFGADYAPYWWSSQFSGYNLIVGQTYGLGTPSLVSKSTNSNDLYVYFRGLGNAAYALAWNGTSWSVDSGLQGGALRGFPVGAQSTSVRRVYVLGTDNMLWENSKGTGAWSGWVSISSAAGATGTPLAGSPSTSASTQGVSARTAAGALGTFSVGATWSFSNQGGGIVGTPTRVSTGTWARAPSNSLWFNNGSSWTSYGGWFE